MAVGPAFSGFEMAGGLDFALACFCVTQLFGFELVTLPSVASFLAEHGLRIFRNISK